jgi:hypothetical protein
MMLRCIVHAFFGEELEERNKKTRIDIFDPGDFPLYPLDLRDDLVPKVVSLLGQVF